MIRHLFKLIWNKRKQNFLFLSEILVSFLVIFAVFSFLVYYFQNYRKPAGFDYKPVWSINYDNSRLSKNADTLAMFYEGLKKNLKSMPQVEEVTYTSSNFPYSGTVMSTGLTVQGRKINQVNTYRVSDGYKKVWSVSLTEGRWFDGQDLAARNKPVVISENLKEEIFGKAPAIGKLLGDYEDKDQMRVIGIVKDVKANGDFLPAEYSMFSPLDTGYYKYTSTIHIKVRPGAGAAFESDLYQFLTNSMKNSTIDIRHLTEMRDSKNEQTIIPMIIFMIVAGFLIMNVALGLFGVLWYNINQRKGEIGLRRALGASGGMIAAQLIRESLILATLSLIAGCFFAFQFPILNIFDVSSGVYLIAILFSVIFIYALVLLCALYPGRQAAAILPAVALHEE